MRNEIYHKLKSIGFQLDKDMKFKSNVGIGLNYKYYPEYLGDNHYTLVIFISKNKTKDGYWPMIDEEDTSKEYRSRDFRLYIHDKDGKYIDSKFQLSDHCDWNIKCLNKTINEIFYREIRKMKLERICYEEND